MGFLLFARGGIDVDLSAQSQHHRSYLLGHSHALLEVLVDSRSTRFGELLEMNALLAAAQIHVELVGIEGCKGCYQLGHSHQTGVESVVSRALVGTHLLAPETFAVEAHIPVAQVVVDKLVDKTACARRVVAVELGTHSLDE